MRVTVNLRVVLRVDILLPIIIIMVRVEDEIGYIHSFLTSGVGIPSLLLFPGRARFKKKKTTNHLSSSFVS